jgi:hypothetical protein
LAEKSSIFLGGPLYRARQIELVSSAGANP